VSGTGRGSFAQLWSRHGLRSFRALRVQQLAAKVRRARAHREQLGETPRGAPGLPPWLRCSKTNVTWLDLFDFPRNLRQEHRKELRRRRLQESELTPTAAVWLSVLALFSGLKGGGGCFLQAPVRALELVIGAGESTVQAANAYLEGEGLIERFPQRVEVEWFDDDGHRHVEADVWAKTRITRRGLERLRSLGEKRRVVMAGPQRGRLLVVTGLLGELLRGCGALLRLLARRVAGANENETPPLRGNTQPEEEPVEGARASRGPVSSTAATGPPSRPHGPSPPSSGARGSMRGWVAGEIERLWRLRALTASQAWPALYWSGDRMSRRQLERDFAELYHAELTRRFVALSTPAERLIQTARNAADGDMLEQFERAEPAEAVKRFRYHQYGELWRPHGRGVPGGAWVTADTMAIGELKKLQLAGGTVRRKRRRARA
jgi:hypothetical protein